ncbi:hypothetical protein [Demequina soli]|uniref:hypothetical protein n=1 Tax=Demequina soli TaxID=1638987 RepID=UPI0007844664|nr:hypothetical protein [Demequina soli]
MTSGDKVTIHLAYKPDVGLAGEWPWATPLETDDRGGIYRLENFLMMTPLVVGDLVRCERGADSRLHVVQLVGLAHGLLLGVKHPRDSEAAVRPVALALDAAGFWVNRPRDGFLQVWAGATPPHLVTDLIARDWPDGWEVVERLDHLGRRIVIGEYIDLDFRPRPLVPAGDSGYWAAEDPAWSRLGITDPARLARVQTLAARDPRVLATIRAGRHADVLEFITRISVGDPRLLPPLTRPLLVDPPGP